MAKLAACAIPIGQLASERNTHFDFFPYVSGLWIYILERFPIKLAANSAPLASSVNKPARSMTRVGIGE